MKTFEKVSVWVRHLPLLERAEWLWGPVRPIYEQAVSHFGRKGLERLINGSDRILVSPRARDVSEKYELDVWRALMAELRPGDTFVDVGAYIGLYTIAVGLRLRGSGRIIAFEPDDHNFSLLQQHVRLNGLEKQIELHQCAVSAKDGQCCFSAKFLLPVPPRLARRKSRNHCPSHHTGQCICRQADRYSKDRCGGLRRDGITRSVRPVALTGASTTHGVCRSSSLCLVITGDDERVPPQLAYCVRLSYGNTIWRASQKYRAIWRDRGEDYELIEHLTKRVATAVLGAAWHAIIPEQRPIPHNKWACGLEIACEMIAFYDVPPAYYTSNLRTPPDIRLLNIHLGCSPNADGKYLWWEWTLPAHSILNCLSILVYR